MRLLNNSNINISKIIHDKLYSKYSIHDNYNLYAISKILSNDKCLIVAKFKDFLLYEDQSEFLKRFYRLEEIGPRLKKLYNYFHKYILIQPNFCKLNESKYMISNLFRKQILMNKNRKNKHKKKLLTKKEKEDKIFSKSDKKFFNNTLYGEILNQSGSFMNKLFGIDLKKENKDKYKETDNDRDIDDFMKIINLIENNEAKNSTGIKNNKEKDKKNAFHKLNDVVDSHYILDKNHYRKTNNYFNSSTFTTTNTTPNIQNILNRYTVQRKAKDLKKDIINNYKSLQKSNKNNDINTEIGQKNINDNNQNIKIDKVIYHRKMKSTLIGDYLNQLELPSNSNIIDSLKKANEAFANNQRNSDIKVNLYKKTKFNSNNKDKSKEIFKNPKYNLNKNFNSINMTRENTDGSGLFGTPMKNEITISKFANLEMPKTIIKNKSKVNCKVNSIYIRNHVPSGLSLNNSKKTLYINNNKSAVKEKENLLLVSFQNSETKNNNKCNNINTKEIYLKPKALYKHKTTGISVKK